MELTHEQWRKERANLVEAVATADAADRRGLIAEAFRRAIRWLDKHPAASPKRAAQSLAKAKIDRDYDALGRS
ncbi:hypothetical protein [Paracoccus pantotrophus]|uniref:hypothetical protein n=1 Tax=Paracoccus pantotrophus TaxID=82367 RepID=UPI0011C065D9|nr:hypothetical protein [Paracoccus pantotrophus]WGR66162.1 hypothetical protein E3U24_12640 [Paracoccus pantotrophus]